MSYGLLSPRSLAGQLVGGGVSGAIVTVIVGMIMDAMNKR
jgi:fucose permease